MGVFYYFNEIGLQILILAVALFSISKLDRFTKNLCLQVVISVLIYIASQVFKDYNNLIYNSYILLETTTVLYAASLLLTLSKKDQILKVFIAITLSVLVIQIVLSNIYTFFNYTYCVSSLFVTITFLYLMFEKISVARKEPHFRSHIIISLGVIVYFACNTPYMGLINYIQEIDSTLNYSLFNFITRVLSNVRYLFLLVGMALMIKNHTAMKVNVS